MELCNDKNKLKDERVKAQDLKQKIVGVATDDFSNGLF